MFIEKENLNLKSHPIQISAWKKPILRGHPNSGSWSQNAWTFFYKMSTILIPQIIIWDEVPEKNQPLLKAEINGVFFVLQKALEG